MMDAIPLDILILILCGGFVAAFIDSVVGGGGLIGLPVLLMTGMPPHIALGTNKLAASMSSLTSTLSFMRSGKINWRLVKWLFPLSFIGAASGTVIVQYIPSSFLKPLVVILLIAVTIYTLVRKNWGKQSTYTKLSTKTGLLMVLVALGMGVYDGFFGPGTGSLLIFAFLLLGFDFVTAAGNAKVLNFGSNIASLMAFMLFQSVDYRIGLLMGASMVLGSLIGSQVAIRQGARFVRPLFIVITLLLVGKQLWDLLQR